MSIECENKLNAEDKIMVLNSNSLFENESAMLRRKAKKKSIVTLDGTEILEDNDNSSSDTDSLKQKGKFCVI